MPKTKRDRLKGDWAMAIIDLDWTMDHITNLHMNFDEQHPELASHLEVALTGCQMVRDILMRFCEHCWGYIPDDITAWRLRK